VGEALEGKARFPNYDVKEIEAPTSVVNEEVSLLPIMPSLCGEKKVIDAEESFQDLLALPGFSEPLDWGFNHQIPLLEEVSVSTEPDLLTGEFPSFGLDF